MIRAAWFLESASWLHPRAVESENLVIDTFELGPVAVGDSLFQTPPHR